MKAEYYANEFRRYATYVRNYKGMGETNWWQVAPLIKIAGGSNAEDLHWTETLMREAGRFMGGLSVHCYIKPGEESSGTVFSKDSWYQTAVNTLNKESLLKQNISIMDFYDPEKRVLMAVDEWGMWVDNEPGTNNAFLFQQNTMRSAMSAALMLHIFQKYSDRIRLCNLAQTINVLQAIIFTEGAKMVKTPTYHLFDLFKKHQDSYYVPVAWDEKPKSIKMGLPNADISASASDNGKVFITIVNLSADDKAEIVLNFAGRKARSVKGGFISGNYSP